MLRILLIDDHTLFRESIVPVLDDLEPSPVVHEAATLEEALPIISHYTDLDLVILDLNFPGLDGREALDLINGDNVTTPILILTGSEEVSDVHRALASGCTGYVTKTCGRRELLTAIRSVVAGDVYVANHLLALVEATTHTKTELKAPPKAVETIDVRFSQRQEQVLELMGKGYANKLIADQLSISEGTVKLHVSAVLRYLNATNRTEAVLTAKQRGYIS